MDEGAQHSRRTMSARDIRPDERRGEVIDILAAGLARIATAPTAAQELPRGPAAASKSTGGKAPDSAATCLEPSAPPRPDGVAAHLRANRVRKEAMRGVERRPDGERASAHDRLGTAAADRPHDPTHRADQETLRPVDQISRR